MAAGGAEAPAASEVAAPIARTAAGEGGGAPGGGAVKVEANVPAAVGGAGASMAPVPVAGTSPGTVDMAAPGGPLYRII